MLAVSGRSAPTIPPGVSHASFTVSTAASSKSQRKPVLIRVSAQPPIKDESPPVKSPKREQSRPTRQYIVITRTVFCVGMYSSEAKTRAGWPPSSLSNSSMILNFMTSCASIYVML